MKSKNRSLKSLGGSVKAIPVWRLALLALILAGGGSAAFRDATSAATLPPVVNLNEPPSAKQEEPSNVALSLSVEFPTVGAAYRAGEYVHDPVNAPYLGYWDVNSCYTYTDATSPAGVNGGYFSRSGAVDGSGFCSGAYSGNLLNYVATSAIDVLRLTLTGGNRALDLTDRTVLARAYLYNGWNLNDGTYFPAHAIKKGYLGKVMPNGVAEGDYVYGGGCRDLIWFGQRGDSAGCDAAGNATSKTGNLNPAIRDAAGKVTGYKKFYARVEVCNTAEGPLRPDLCQRYPSGNYKPVGQLQLKADNTRISAFGYLAEDGNGRYGGVLRAPMGYLSPALPNGSVNTRREWDAITGVFVDKPLDTSFAYSGVVNYLNRFGTTGTPGYYKSNDPVGELYYETLRYFMGLGPTSKAVANSSGKEDGYPVYTAWDDPVQNACQRKNYILVIGDVNTHNDKELPGNSGLSDGNDASRAPETLLGGGTFNAKDWTKVIGNFETDAAGSYTNSLGVSVSTKGNPNPISGNSGLESKRTGSGGSSAYLWAGAAYWAHTQPIRSDNDGDGVSRSGVRVNTFTIDVDEGGNGKIDGNTRGIQPRNSSFYLAGKYGWFNNTDSSKINVLKPLASGALGPDEQLDGHPFRNILSGSLDNSRWEYAGAPNTPDGYAIASQAAKLQEAIKRFFNSLGGAVTPATVSDFSSLSFSSYAPDGDVFVPQFEPKNWSGTVLKASVKFNNATGSMAITSTKWDAGKILTDASVAVGAVSDPYVKPGDRKIFTYSRADAHRGGQPFTAANKGSLDPEVLAALAVKPPSAPAALSDADMQDAHIDWIRGGRVNEAGAATGYLRSRTLIMGDVVNSGPVYKKGADKDVSGVGYAAFAHSVADRQGVVYVGSNDGMMHAFRESDGKELFGYVPRAIATKVAGLASPNYVHQPYVDAVPVVSEAQVKSGSPPAATWKTLLISGLGGGAQGIFALDVTSPGDFSSSSVLFEFTDEDDADMGNVLGQPKLVRMKKAGSSDTGWYVAVSSGYNNHQADGHASTSGTQALFLLSVDKAPGDTWELNRNYFKVMVAPPDSGRAIALANPGVAKDIQGNAVLFYAGDTQGNLWKFDFQSGLDAAAASNAIKKASGGAPVPMAILKDAANKVQPITTSPVVAEGLKDGYMVMFGTGKFIEAGDGAASEVNAVYGIWDNLSNVIGDWKVTRSKLYGRSFSDLGKTTGDASFVYGTGDGAYRGWYVTLPISGERVVTDPDTRFGYVAVNSLVPPADCASKGSGATMALDNLYGTTVSSRSYQTVGYLSRPRIVQVDLSENDAYTYTPRSSTGRRDMVVNSIPVSTTGGSGGSPVLIQGSTVSQRVPAGRVGWREIKNF